MQRAAHGNHLTKSKRQNLAHGSNPIRPATPSSRPRDAGSAAGARTREDIRLPQERRSEDRRRGGLTTYEYDLYGNLLRVDLPDGRAIEYEVDGAGRRVGRRELDADGFEISFRGWIYRDLLRPIAEVDAFGSVVARYIYSDGDGAAQNGVYQLSTRLGANQDTSLPFSGSNVPESIELLDPGTGQVIQRLQLSTNQVGSVQLVTDADTGEVLQRIEYDEFGRVVFDSNPGVQPFGFAGGLYDEESGLVRFGARDYSADVGRWIAKDPTRFIGGANAYTYVSNESVGRSDVDGLIERWGRCHKVLYYVCVISGPTVHNLPKWNNEVRHLCRLQAELICPEEDDDDDPPPGDDPEGCEGAGGESGGGGGGRRG